MATIHERFGGLFIPYVTPFNHDGSLDPDSLARLTTLRVPARRCRPGFLRAHRRKSGAQPRRETTGLRSFRQGRARSRHVHIATIMPQSTDEAVELIRDLENLAVDGVMIFPPLLFAWGKVEPNLKVRFFEDLARDTKLPARVFPDSGQKLLLRCRHDLPDRPLG